VHAGVTVCSCSDICAQGTLLKHDAKGPTPTFSKSKSLRHNGAVNFGVWSCQEGNLASVIHEDLSLALMGLRTPDIYNNNNNNNNNSSDFARDVPRQQIF
jgi:hypothetical protein